MSSAAFRTKIIAKQENARDRRQLPVSEHNFPTCYGMYNGEKEKTKYSWRFLEEKSEANRSISSLFRDGIGKE